jgi:adenylate cyclase
MDKTKQSPLILIVDDIQKNIQLLGSILGGQYRISAAKNGPEALKLVEKVLPDLILLDIMMPEMDGYEVCRRIKADSRTKDIPIIFLTAKTEVADETAGLELGAVDYITKPIRAPIVMARVRTHLQLKTATDFLRKKNEELLRLNEELDREKQKSDKLLLNVLPARIAEQLKMTGRTVPESFENVAVLFSDLVGFTKISSEIEPIILINELNEIFTAFDAIIESNECERIKTIGDAYMAVCGMPDPNERYADNIVRSAVQILQFLEKKNRDSAFQWKVRIGIHAGKVVGGVVGVKKYIYDV